MGRFNEDAIRSFEERLVRPDSNGTMIRQHYAVSIAINVRYILALGLDLIDSDGGPKEILLYFSNDSIRCGKQFRGHKSIDFVDFDPSIYSDGYRPEVEGMLNCGTMAVAKKLESVARTKKENLVSKERGDDGVVLNVVGESDLACLFPQGKVSVRWATLVVDGRKIS